MLLPRGSPSRGPRSSEPGSDSVANGHERRGWPQHHDELRDAPVLVVAQEVDALNLSISNAAGEAEHLAVSFPDLPFVDKLREQHLTDNPEERADALTTLVGSERDRAAELHTRRERGLNLTEVLALDGRTERTPSIAVRGDRLGH